MSARMSLHILSERLEYALREVKFDGTPDDAKRIAAIDNLSNLSPEAVDEALDDYQALQALADGLKAKGREFTDKATLLRSIAENRKLAVKKFLLAQGVRSYGGARHRVAVFKTSKVDIIDEEMLPEELAPRETVIKPDKKAIKEALKAGAVPGALLDEDENGGMRIF